jgi:hypothetical protein
VDCADGRRTRITRLAAGGEDLNQDSFHLRFGADSISVISP